MPIGRNRRAPVRRRARVVRDGCLVAYVGLLAQPPGLAGSATGAWKRIEDDSTGAG